MREVEKERLLAGLTLDFLSKDPLSFANEWDESLERSTFPEEGMGKKGFCGGPSVHIHLQSLVQEVLEFWRKFLPVWNLRSTRRRDQVESPQRRLLQVRRLSVNHLDRHYPQRPNVHLRSVLLTRHHLHNQTQENEHHHHEHEQDDQIRSPFMSSCSFLLYLQTFKNKTHISFDDKRSNNNTKLHTNTYLLSWSSCQAYKLLLSC
jgi:hypothetical protein